MRSLLLLTFFITGNILLSQNTQNSKKEAILKSHEGIWAANESLDNPYFISVEIKKDRIIWNTVAETEDGNKLINMCMNDTVLLHIAQKETALKDTFEISMTGATDVKGYKTTLLPQEDFTCPKKAESVSFTSVCFWEPTVKIEMVFYCENKLLLLITDSKGINRFLFKK